MMDDGSFVYDPDFTQEKVAKLHIIVAGTKDAITMVEAGGNEASEVEMMSALEYAHTLVVELCEAQEDFLRDYETQFGIKAITPTFNLPDETLYHTVQAYLTEEKLETLYHKGKKEFQYELDTLDEEVKKYLIES